jgi:dipeptidyl aminopeptidase/acylaminoacyl peptidase
MTNRRGFCLLCCALSLLVQTVYPQQLNSPLPLEDLARAGLLGTIVAFSPDGQWISYTVRNTNNGGAVTDPSEGLFSRTGTPPVGVGLDVWIVNTKTGESRNLTRGQGNSWGPSWSPKGSSLAFYSDRSGAARLWLWEGVSGTVREVSQIITHPYTAEDTPRWTSDGKRILTKVLPEGTTLKQASMLTVPKGEKVADQDKVKGSTVVLYRSMPAEKEHLSQSQKPRINQSLVANAQGNAFLADLALVDVSSGKVERIAQGYRPCWYDFSPDGTELAFVTEKGLANVNLHRNIYDLIVISLAEAQAHVVAKDIESIAIMLVTVSWSPDSKMLSYTDFKDLDSGDCYLIPLSGGERKLTKNTHPSFASGYRPPLWDAAGESLYLIGGNAIWKVSVRTGALSEVARIPNKKLTEVVVRRGQGRYWSPDGHSMVVSTLDEETKQAGFYRIDLATGRPIRLIEEDKVYRAQADLFMDVSADGGSMAYVAQDVQHADDVWLADAGFETARQLTHISPELERYAMGSARLVEWRSEDGQNLRGALLLPSGYEQGKRYPLIVVVYGGELRSNFMNHFGLGTLSTWLENKQILATRGYAVLLPDTPLRVGTPMQDLAKTVLPGVDKTIELGIVDPDRLGVMGASYGGYSTLALITQTTRFKAAAMHAGFGDLISMYGDMNEEGDSRQIFLAERGLMRMGGTPWEYRDRYIENSPVFYLDRVVTPLLITHGTSDGAVPPFASNEVFVDLRRLGKEVVYAKYKNEDHAFTSLANQLDLWNRRIEWFDQHLKGAPGDKKDL